MPEVVLHIFRGNDEGGEFKEYKVPVQEGMVVLDAILYAQGSEATTLACRWNCKAGKCGSCSAEINGKPRLLCMTRLDLYPADEPISISPMKTFPIIKDLVTDVSWNYKVNQRITPLTTKPDANWKMFQRDVERSQEFRKCIECFLCQNVCHVLRDHDMKDEFAGPRFFVRMASLEMHPLDIADRVPFLKNEAAIGLCNITKCCTEVCPEHIHITDNAIIPLKERVVSRYYDPFLRLWRWLSGASKKQVV